MALGLKGKVAIKLKLHLGALGILPPRMISLILNLRSALFRLKTGGGKAEMGEQLTSKN